MSDIGRRIRRYRLSRYAPPHATTRRRLRWAWLGLASWMVWAGLMSDHSFLQLWRLDRENVRARQELAQLQVETARLEARQRDPRAIRDIAEHALREKDGMAKHGEIVYRISPAAGDSLARD